MIYKQIIQGLDQFDINELSMRGLTKQQINESIICCFDKFFENKGNLDRYAKDFLVQDWITYKRNFYIVIDDNINEVLNIFKAAKIKDTNKVFEAVSNFQEISVEIGNKYWSMVIMQRNMSEFGDFEYIAECFNLIDQICEIIIKNYLFLIVQMHRISKNKNSDFNDIQKLTFGDLINELNQAKKLDNLLNYFDSSISISQWRNIACHKSYKYNDGKIECKYGKDLEHSTTIDNKKDLLDITNKLNKIAQAINFAYKFFFYDNIQDIGSIFNQTNNDIKSRDETWHLIFVTELYSNGFRVIEIEDKQDKLKILLQEMTLEDKEKRSIQSSIALYKAWFHSSKKNIEIIYVDIDGYLYLSSSTTALVCEEIGKGNKDINYLAQNAVFKKLSKLKFGEE